MNTGSASLPHHQYVWVDRSFIREGGTGYEQAVWFGLHSHPGRAWGCTFLSGLQAHSTAGILCDYLFTAVPIGDGYSEHPSQSKEFMFMRTNGERLLILPTNKLRFIDKSFTVEGERPRLKLSDTVWSCEEQ